MEISYPKVDFRIRNDAGVQRIWDVVRKQWIVLTPEEWVRQNFVQYLIDVKKYPASLLSIEKTIELNGLKKRYDIVVFKNSKPWLAIECKEPKVTLSIDTFMQIIRYNMVLQVPFLVLTNGQTTMGWTTIGEKVEPLTEIPAW